MKRNHKIICILLFTFLVVLLMLVATKANAGNVYPIRLIVGTNTVDVDEVQYSTNDVSLVITNLPGGGRLAILGINAASGSVFSLSSATASNIAGVIGFHNGSVVTQIVNLAGNAMKEFTNAVTANQVILLSNQTASIYQPVKLWGAAAANFSPTFTFSNVTAGGSVTNIGVPYPCSAGQVFQFTLEATSNNIVSISEAGGTNNTAALAASALQPGGTYLTTTVGVSTVSTFATTSGSLNGSGASATYSGMTVGNATTAIFAGTVTGSQAGTISTAVQPAAIANTALIPQLAAGGVLTNLSGSGIFFLRTNGNDATAIPYDETHPWASIGACANATKTLANSNDVIQIGIGTFVMTNSVQPPSTVGIVGLSRTYSILTSTNPTIVTGCTLVNAVAENFSLLQTSTNITSGTALLLKGSYVVRNVTSLGWGFDNLTMGQNSGSAVSGMSNVVENCYLSGYYDTVALKFGTGRVFLNNNTYELLSGGHLNTNGLNQLGGASSDRAIFNFGSIEAHVNGGTIISSALGQSNVAIYASGASTTYVDSVSFWGTNGTTFAAENDGTGLIVMGPNALGNLLTSNVIFQAQSMGNLTTMGGTNLLLNLPTVTNGLASGTLYRTNVTAGAQIMIMP
jgi:CheY-specific phosphatase CheX